MKVQEVIMRAMAKRITWWEAAEILGIDVRTMRRWRERMKQDGFTGLFDRRKHPSPKRVPLDHRASAESVSGEILGLRHLSIKLCERPKSSRLLETRLE